ncbi:probable leucine-rich repeat receptor-like protein kinase At2g28990 [Lolium rigidum]|uniref:probable leucine-rich repeat receptor-like protein kinase At2g28990 n=1 Tax=Lolium rigidum TaxID=89674 RepID=UPI001F5C860D|nr:probable leucine-rich repeat receptor-like protein kinase At2g28990 [Lolium rigidum]
MALFVFLAALVLVATADHDSGQPGHQSGFLSIDCGVGPVGDRRDTRTGIEYVSDGLYVDGGENHRIASNQSANDESLKTLRSFPSGVRSCYTLPTEEGTKYLVRMVFNYGNYDGKAHSPSFDIHLGNNYWDTFLNRDYWWSEAIFVAWASWVPVCVVNTGGGTPFVSTVELRPLNSSLYPDATVDEYISTHERTNLGADHNIRYPDDPYDRIWEWSTSSSLANISTEQTIQQDDLFQVPIPVLQTGLAPVNNGTAMSYIWDTYQSSLGVKMILHFADIQNRQVRLFDVHFNGMVHQNYSPPYLSAGYLYNTDWYRSTDGNYNITIQATNKSMLPPMMNAYEIYNRIPHDTPSTFSKDFDAMMAIKLEYGVKRNWMGDPCFPVKFAWNGVKCSNITKNTTRITSLDLSNSNLNGSISDNFTLLTELQFLDLSGNNMNGPVPDPLCKRSTGPLNFRYESDKNMCNKTKSPSRSKNRTTIISISVVVFMVVVVGLVLSCLIWRRKRKPKVSTYDAPRPAKPHTAPVSITSKGDHLHNSENRQFTYKELEKLTNKFERSIGQGGFGLVYYGRLEDDTEVAVKMRSEHSSHGLDEFLAEVNSLTKVHHRNLVSLVGYCWEKDHLALVYEYMSEGSLTDQLRGKTGVGKTLGWTTRVQIVLESAQGLDYLHKGCSLPIIHRDVKTNNILLGQNLRAKIADFGLCKTYLSEMQTHISTNAAGSAGYMDPEYYHTGWLTESSDVYSFGVVLLEVATGEPPILPGHGHIVQRVKQKIATGNISMVADAKLRGAYDVNSMWKLVDTAMACTADASIRRPTMAVVMAQLKESLALEESREDNSIQGSFTSTTGGPVSTFGPSAR